MSVQKFPIINLYPQLSILCLMEPPSEYKTEKINTVDKTIIINRDFVYRRKFPNPETLSDASNPIALKQRATVESVRFLPLSIFDTCAR